MGARICLIGLRNLSRLAFLPLLAAFLSAPPRASPKGAIADALIADRADFFTARVLPRLEAVFRRAQSRLTLQIAYHPGGYFAQTQKCHRLYTSRVMQRAFAGIAQHYIEDWFAVARARVNRRFHHSRSRKFRLGQLEVPPPPSRNRSSTMHATNPLYRLERDLESCARNAFGPVERVHATVHFAKPARLPPSGVGSSSLCYGVYALEQYYAQVLTRTQLEQSGIDALLAEIARSLGGIKFFVRTTRTGLDVEHGRERVCVELARMPRQLSDLLLQLRDTAKGTFRALVEERVGRRRDAAVADGDGGGGAFCNLHLIVTIAETFRAGQLDRPRSRSLCVIVLSAAPVDVSRRKSARLLVYM